MKYFIIEGNYTVPIEEIEKVVEEHRKFLEKGYKEDIILISGPQNPRIGGVIIAKANNLKELQEFFSDDPFQLYKAATYRYTEFIPSRFQPFLKDWIGKE